MEILAAYFPLDPRAPPTPSFSSLTSRSSRSSIACGLEERQDTASDQKPEDTVTGMLVLLLPSPVRRILLPILGNSLQRKKNQISSREERPFYSALI